GVDWHAHHSWPMFVGGLPAQPLMGIRGFVHLSVLHPLLNPVLTTTFRVTTSTTKNAAFIARMATPAGRADRNRMAAELTAFYAAFSAGSCSPGIPPAAYAAGIAAALVFLGGP